MQRHPELRAEMILAGLPARDEPLCEPLLDQLQPRLIIVMDAAAPATRRAPSALRARLARRGIPIIYCRDAGSVTLEIAPSSWRIADASGRGVALTAPPRGQGEEE